MKSIIPLNYKLEFEPNLETFTFKGREIIEFICKNQTNKIKLNAIELQIQHCVIKNKDKTITVRKICFCEENRELEISLKEKIKGKTSIHIEFTGILNDKMVGFYRSQYKQKGKTVYLATTQFEAQDACRAFPCWDHPNAKSTFDITIIANNDLTAISNMPLKSKKKLEGKTSYQFFQTPRMSTYLVYLGIGKYGIKSKKINGGRVEIRFIAPPGNEKKGQFALDITAKLLKEYERYFGIKYPLPKLDLIAIPDFDSSAMENWGAITFRESVLYYDPQTSSTDTLQYNATTISHEIAHQWFGNLVTMKWWNDLWLNESFATFMATKFTDKFYPEWDLWDQFIVHDTNLAMELDSLKSSHPIDVPVKSPEEIGEIFDAISYEKGGSILLMLENYVGEADFRKGLKSYLKKFKYQNAEGTDLWNEINTVSKKSGVLKMVKGWLKNTGYPLVTVTKQNSKYTIKQERFLRIPSSNQKIMWPIPISIGIKNQISNNLMTRKLENIPLKQNCIIVNFERSGFYRVKYDKSLLLEIKSLIENKKISPINRWAIQYDLFALCMAGNEKIEHFLDFINSYHNEEDYLPLIDIIANLNFLYSLTFFEKFNPKIKIISTNILKKILQRLSWEPKNNEKNTQRLLRSNVIESLGKMEDYDVKLKSQQKFKQYLKNPKSISADLLEPIFITTAWNGNASTHKQLISLYNKVQTEEEKVRVLTSLAYFKNKDLIVKTLEFSLSDAVRIQNLATVMKNIGHNPYGSKILWPWLKNNWEKLTDKTGKGNTVLKKILGAISEITDESQIKEVEEFFKNNPVPGTDNTLKQELERAIIYSRFLKRTQKEFLSK